MKDNYTTIKFSTYLKERFRVKVHKVSVDAGFSCPNKDGKISRQGCIYCDNKAFSFQSRSDKVLSLEDQIEQGMEAAKKRFKAEKFIVYFQAYTNTYAPVDRLKERYDTIKKFKDVVGLSIATRPDCVDEKVLGLIDSYADDYDVWVEYGLQSVHDETLAYIKRGHTYEDFLRAVSLTRKYRIKICAHVIIGLPNETEEMVLDTAKAVSDLKIDGIKIHPLHIIKGTPLETLFQQGGYEPLGLSRYLELLSKFLTLMRPDTVVQRVSAYCPPELLIAPGWISQRNIVENRY